MVFSQFPWACVTPCVSSYLKRKLFWEVFCWIFLTLNFLFPQNMEMDWIPPHRVDVVFSCSSCCCHRHHNKLFGCVLFSWSPFSTTQQQDCQKLSVLCHHLTSASLSCNVGRQSLDLGHWEGSPPPVPHSPDIMNPTSNRFNALQDD